MNEELEVLKIVTQRLNDADVSYMISGSMAANYYAIPRMTRDIDIVIELKELNVNKFVDLFRDDFYIDKDTVRREVRRRGIFNIIHNEYIVKIDFILHQDSNFQKSCFKRRKRINIDQNIMWMISAEDLILAKLLWAQESLSELQLNDVTNLYQSAADLDKNYIEQWVDALNLDQMYKDISKNA